jgi:hypothetical protein
MAQTEPNADYEGTNEGWERHPANSGISCCGLLWPDNPTGRANFVRHLDRSHNDDSSGAKS